MAIRRLIRVMMLMMMVNWGPCVIGTPAGSRTVPHQCCVAACLVTAFRVPRIAEEPGGLGSTSDGPASRFQNCSARNWRGTSDVQRGGSNSCEEKYDGGGPHGDDAGHASSDFVG